MARNANSCFAVPCVLLLLVLFVSSSLLVLEAWPLSNIAVDSISGDTVKKGQYLEVIKAGGGPSPRGKGRGFPGSGPSPGEGHYVKAIKAGGSPSPGGKGHGSPGSSPSPGVSR